MERVYWDHHIRPPKVAFPDLPVPSDVEEYLFDLQGFVLLRGALSADEVAACNACVDRIPRSLQRNEWFGYVQREDHPEHRGISLQQIYEAGAPFERLIDHPSYINYVLRFVGGQDAFDYHHGPLFIDENFFSIRGPGEAIPLHAGGHDRCKRMQYRYHNGRFQCGQINVLIAHTDIGPGDGATMVIPGSHKSNLIHPAFLRKTRNEWGEGEGGSALGIEGAIEVHMAAGDALIFVDACCHGSARRVNPGERRISVYRYGSSWNRTRWGYEPSAALLARLNPFARQLVSTGSQQVRRPPAEVR
jgi:hypothetical protein